MSVLWITRVSAETAMVNRPAMHKTQGIQSPAAARHSEWELAEALGVSRGVVGRHLGREGSTSTKSPTGSGADESTRGNGQARSNQSKSTRRGPPGYRLGRPSLALLQVPKDTRRKRPRLPRT